MHSHILCRLKPCIGPVAANVYDTKGAAIAQWLLDCRSRSSDQSSTWGMIRNEIHLIRPVCLQPSIALQHRITAWNTIHFTLYDTFKQVMTLYKINEQGNSILNFCWWLWPWLDDVDRRKMVVFSMFVFWAASSVQQCHSYPALWRYFLGRMPLTCPILQRCQLGVHQSHCSIFSCP